MIEIITDTIEIGRLHKQFHKSLENSFDQRIPIYVGFPAGNFHDFIQYSSDLNIWLSFNDSDYSRFWNGFGVDQPLADRMNSLTGEINFPKTGIDRRTAGAFGRESDGNILVLHRGKIGGGQPGVGKNLFVDNFRGEFVTALDGKVENRFCLVGELHSNLFPRQVADFIWEIRRIKDIVKNGKLNEFKELENFKFSDEHSGSTTSNRLGPTIIKRTHGLVVNALARELERLNFKVGNDKNRDLFIHRKSKIITLFEVKTNSRTHAIYSAIGQLILYSIPITNDVKLRIVIPGKLTKMVETRLYKIGIQPLYYDWVQGEPIFKGLEESLK